MGSLLDDAFERAYARDEEKSSKERLRSVKGPPMSDVQVTWLASWPRSGNTLLRQILWQRFEVASCSLYPNDLGDNEDLIRSCGHYDSSRVVNGQRVIQVEPHNGVCAIKSHSTEYEKGHRCIYVARDGREAIASLWRFYDRTVPVRTLIDACPQFGNWGEHLEAWFASPNRLWLTYDELNTEDALDKIGAYLGIEPTIRRPVDRLPSSKWVSPEARKSWREIMTAEDEEYFWQVNGGAMDRFFPERETEKF